MLGYYFPVLKYIDKDEMWFQFPEVIINVESINKIYGSVHSLVSEYYLKASTNGKLLVLGTKEKFDFSPYSFISSICDKFPFKEGEDFIMTCYYNKTLEEKMNLRTTCIFKNYSKDWLYAKVHSDRITLALIPLQQRESYLSEIKHRENFKKYIIQDLSDLQFPLSKSDFERLDKYMKFHELNLIDLPLKFSEALLDYLDDQLAKTQEKLNQSPLLNDDENIE